MHSLQFKFYMSCHSGIYGGEGAGLHLIQCFVICLIRVQISYYTLHRCIQFLCFFSKYILQSYFVLRCRDIEIEMLHISEFILFHPHLGIEYFFTFFRSNSTPKLITIFGLNWWRGGYSLCEHFLFQIEFCI